MVLKARLFTCVDVESKWSKLLWKFGNNTVIRCDFINIQSLPPLTASDKMELSRPSHPHHTPGVGNKDNDVELQSAEHQDDSEQIESGNNIEHQNEEDIVLEDEEVKESVAANEEKEALSHSVRVQVDESYVLGLNEFYYLFLFLEDKLPELAAWLMQQSEQNQNNMLLRALSAKSVHKMGNDMENGNGVSLEEADAEKEEKKENGNEMMMEQMAIQQQQQEQQGLNEIEDNSCIICFDKLVNPVCLSCGHEYCKDCIEDWQQQIGAGKECPICRCMIEQSQIWVKLDSEDLSRTQYMMDLLKFPFEYVSKFPLWKDTMIQ